ncbi:spermine oxidase-like isoform X2 [Prorops nasuta]|uniref:spermine oxidase-like isoform X2 n=1 Tax=Prorops nasuta TaxID=863751 RepID=UPI0034D01A0B
MFPTTLFISRFYKNIKENPVIELNEAKQFLDWIEKFDNSLQCSDSWFDVSAKGLREYWECDGDPLLNWKDRGYKTVFEILMKAFPNSPKALPILKKVEFNKEVYSIDYHAPNEIVVKTADGMKYSANHVIFTASLGVLKDRQSTMFHPFLPSRKQLAIKSLNIGTANKIFLEFPHQWWEPNSAGFCMIWPEEEKLDFLKTNKDSQWLLDVFQFFTVDYQPRVLCAWICGPNARYIESLPDCTILDGLSTLLETFLGKTYNVVKPDRMLRSKWFMDKHIRGSYTFLSMTSEELNVRPRDLAEPITDARGKPILMFAGEATDDHYFSTVHGAVGSGFREADRLIHHYRQVIMNFNSRGRTLCIINQPQRTRIIIVGAGMAGIAAAKTLEDNNFRDYLLLEAQEQVGGRINTINWNQTWIDCGAQFLHGNQSKLAEICYKNHLLSAQQAKDGEGIFLLPDGTEVPQKFVYEIDDLIRDALEECEDSKRGEIIQQQYGNIGTYLKACLKLNLCQKNESLMIRKIKRQIFDWNVKFLMIDNSCFTLEELSVKHWGKFKFVGGPEHLLFKHGYQALTRTLTDGINKKNIKLNTVVDNITFKKILSNDEPPISVTLSNKSQILSDCIIITCSLGYLKENHKRMFGSSLPSSWSQAINSLGFGVINKIFLYFDEPWWDLNAKGFQFMWPEDFNSLGEKLAAWTRYLTGFDILQNIPGVLLGWVGGEGAYIIEELSEKVVALDCMKLIRYYLKRDNIPEPKMCKHTKWYKNKFIRGSYSHITTKCDDLDITPAVLAEPCWLKIAQNGCIKNVPVMMLAGEATHESFYSTTHGAYETGVNQAQKFLNYYSQQI